VVVDCRHRPVAPVAGEDGAVRSGHWMFGGTLQQPPLAKKAAELLI
jgi:hypothetical protein